MYFCILGTDGDRALMYLYCTEIYLQTIPLMYTQTNVITAHIPLNNSAHYFNKYRLPSRRYLWLNKWYCQRLPQLYVQQMTQRQQHNEVYRYSSHQIHWLRTITPISRNVTSPSQRSVPSKHDILSRYVHSHGNSPYRQATEHEVRREKWISANWLCYQHKTETSAPYVNVYDISRTFHLDPPKKHPLTFSVY